MKNDFLFGVATSSLQIEGTKNNFKTIWDLPNNGVIDDSDCVEACNFVDKYKDDVKSIKELGVDVYRMSISWSRVWPTEEGFSQEGISFYHTIFKELSKNDILIDVTLYHWDMPLWLYQKGIGFHSKDIVEYFLTYSKRMFKEFDHYVNNWSTLNEPWCISRLGYLYKEHAPFIANNMQKTIQADYYIMMAHKAVYDFYKDNYKKQIGIVLNVWGIVPLNNTENDKLAAKNSHLFNEGVYLSPLFKGEYDPKWLELLQKQNLDFSFMDKEELNDLKNKTDFLGINYYTHSTVTYDESSIYKYKQVQTIYPHTDMGWEINPDGLKNVLQEIRKKYTIKPIYITENGSAFKDTLENGQVNDILRVEYLKKHLYLVEQLKDQLNIKGYYVWSLMDNFEWHFGYTKRFGLIYINFDDFKRIPKKSFYEYQKIIKEKRK